MIETNADPLPALNVEHAFEQWREARWTTEWGGVWAPPRMALELEAFAAGYEAGLRALAEAGLVRHGVDNKTERLPGVS